MEIVVNDLILITFGAFIGSVLSILTSIINKKMDKHGVLKLYTKIVNNNLTNDGSWGFYNSGDGDIAFHVPLWIEIQNTSNSVKIMRDFNLFLYSDGKYVSKMIQVNNYTINKDGVEKAIFYGNNGVYSFVIEPQSIVNFKCFFIIKKSSIDTTFDEMKIEFYDAKDQENKFRFRTIDKCWDTMKREHDFDWVKISS